MIERARIDAFANPEDWRILRVLGAYRLLLIALIAGVCWAGYAPALFDGASGASVLRIALAYLVPAMLMQIATSMRWPSLNIQSQVAFLVDATAIIALMHATSGLSSGLGVLLITPAVGSSLVLPLRLGLLDAAIGTFALFGAEFLSQSESGYRAAELTTIGLLGLMLFAIALGAGAVAARARKSEALAARVGSDLASASRLNERIVESMALPVIVLDEDRRIRLLNVAARRLLDSEPPAPNLPVADLLPTLDAALRAWQDNPNREPEPIHLRDDGPELLPRFTRLGHSPWTPVLVLLDDATRLREEAQQLKLAALGRLSAGIAHEIRNPLSAIRHAGQLLAESPALGAEDRRLLDMIQRHTVRIDKIVGDVLRLSRREAAAPQAITLHEFLERAAATYREGCPDCERPIDLRGVPLNLRVRFDPAQLQQVLHNLWQNSFEHGARSGQPVQVRLRGGWLSPGQRPYLDIADDGAGIPAEQQDKLFEPFFTTAHHGTGLGLYLSRELCEYNHARLMHVASERGTQFRIIFAAA